MDKPAIYIYRIQVRGELDAAWSDRISGMDITVDRSDAEGPVTTLMGRLPDQAALSGVLETLYELRLRVLEVKCLGQQET